MRVTLNTSNHSTSAGGGISFVGLLALLFIALKLLNKIDWSWWWVLSPIWISACVVLLIFAVFVVYMWFKK